MIANEVGDLIGLTSHLWLKRFEPAGSILGKIESGNPGFSVKDRIARAMIEAAERAGQLRPGGHIVEPTSGNTGIGLAMIAASRGYSITLVMPDTMSIERRKMLTQLGAKLILTPGKDGMKAAINKANEIEAETGCFQPRQFENPANPQVHEETTGPELWEATNGDIDILVCGVGTGGTITGAGRYLKAKNPELRLIAVEPADSPVLSGGQPAPHKIQGIGAGFIPSILALDLIDGIETVTNDSALETAREVTLKEGISVGISSGAALVAARRISRQNSKKVIAVILPDSGERYLSTLLFQTSDE